MKYILSQKSEGCIFCEKPRENKDKENYILFRGEHGFVILNAFPYNNGHLMIAPYRHVPNLEELSDEELLSLTSLLKSSIRLLRKELKPDGFNIGMNIGKVAGAGIDDHVHLHVVPRWIGDVNFMPVISETKVISEYLDMTYEKLIVGWRSMEGSKDDEERIGRRDEDEDNIGVEDSKRKRCGGGEDIRCREDNPL